MVTKKEIILIEELNKRNPYPKDIFAKSINNVKFWKRVTTALKKEGISPDAVFGCWGRQVWNNAVDEGYKILEEN